MNIFRYENMRNDFVFFILVAQRAFPYELIQNFSHFFPYFQYISNKSFIFVIRFPLISVMNRQKAVFISL